MTKRKRSIYADILTALLSLGIVVFGFGVMVMAGKLAAEAETGDP